MVRGSTGAAAGAGTAPRARVSDVAARVDAPEAPADAEPQPVGGRAPAERVEAEGRRAPTLEGHDADE
eukprot:1666833-Lingulodinium_polyedra.AAC.1